VQIWSRDPLELRGNEIRVVHRVDTKTMVCGPKAFTDEMIAILHKVAYDPFIKRQLASQS